MHQAGLNIMAFCKEFNARTQGIKARRIRGLVRCPSLPVLTMPRRSFVSRQEDVPLPVLVTAYKDKSFEFVRSRISRLALCTRLTEPPSLAGREKPARHVFHQEGCRRVAAASLARAASLTVMWCRYLVRQPETRACASWLHLAEARLRDRQGAR